MVNSSKCVRCGKTISDMEYIRYGGVCQECWSVIQMEKKKKQYELDAQKYRFVPADDEWHLVDENGKVLYSMPDPFDELFNECIECENLDDVRGVVDSELDGEKTNWEINYEGTEERHALVPFDKLPKSTCELMARALYDYYVAV